MPSVRPLSLVLATLLAACGGGSSDGGAADGSTPPPVANVIGPAGGTVDFEEVSLVIPPGALDRDVEIGVAVRQGTIDDFERLSAVYEFSPAGLVFQAPATLNFTLRAADPDARVFHAATAESPLEEVPGAVVDGTTATAPIAGFSFYVVGKRVRPDIGDTFEHEGFTYSSKPISDGSLLGFGYSYPDAAGVSDGDGPGRVWYGEGYCATFRVDGTGVYDDLGGRQDRLRDLPWLEVEWMPGTPRTVYPQGLWDSPAGNKILDPEFDRTASLRSFRWGVRLNEDGSVHVNTDGFHEYRMVFDDGTAAGALWDPATNAPGDSIFDRAKLTTEPPPEHHFCYFREKRTTSTEDTHSRCVETSVQFEGVPATKRACYAKGVLHGPWEVKTDDGVTVEIGEFADSRPVGGWTFRKPDGKDRARGEFSEHGLHRGVWESYDHLGKLDAKVTFKSGLHPTGRGSFYRVFDGTYTSYRTTGDGTTHYKYQEGVYLDGKQNLWWATWDERGWLTSSEEYDAATQIPTGGQTCFRLESGENQCFPDTHSWRKRYIGYDWGRCVRGVNVWTEITYDQEGHTVTQECYDLEGTGEDPRRGAPRECGSVCGA